MEMRKIFIDWRIMDEMETLASERLASDGSNLTSYAHALIFHLCERNVHFWEADVMDMMTFSPLAYPKSCPHAWNGVFKRHCLLVVICLSSENLQKLSTFSAMKCKFIIIERWSIFLFMTFTKRNWELVLMKQIHERKPETIYTCVETSASFYLLYVVRNFFIL